MARDKYCLLGENRLSLEHIVGCDVEYRHSLDSSTFEGMLHMEQQDSLPFDQDHIIQRECCLLSPSDYIIGIVIAAGHEFGKNEEKLVHNPFREKTPRCQIALAQQSLGLVFLYLCTVSCLLLASVLSTEREPPWCFAHAHKQARPRARTQACVHAHTDTHASAHACRSALVHAHACTCEHAGTWLCKQRRCATTLMSTG